jgi:hypothetical protein
VATTKDKYLLPDTYILKDSNYYTNRIKLEGSSVKLFCDKTLENMLKETI